MTNLHSFSARHVCATVFALMVLMASPVQAQKLPGTALEANQVSPDIQLLFQLAEIFNPQVFSGGSGWRLHDGYTYQYFAFSQTYAGVKNSEVFVLGGNYGSQIARVGSLSSVLALLLERTQANFITMSRRNVVFEYSTDAAVLPVQRVELTSKIATGYTLVPGANWISVSRSSGSTQQSGAVDISINANAASLSPGMHTSSVLVRNASDFTLSVHLPVVVYVAEPGVTVTNSVANVLAFKVTDMIGDPQRGLLYFADKDAKRVYAVDAASGRTTRYFQFTRMPIRLALSPDGDRLYIALADHEYQYYGPEPQSGAIGIVNLETERLLGSFTIDIDPYDLAVTANDRVLVSSGSGQWTEMHMYDASAGVKLAEMPSRHLSEMSLHPNQEWLYLADTDSSPSGLIKYDLTGDRIAYVAEARYFDDRIKGNVWVTPNGRHVYTRGGNVFLASSLLYVTTLPGMVYDRFDDLAFDVSDNTAVMLTASNKVVRFDLTSFLQVEAIGTGLTDPVALEVMDGTTYVVDLAGGAYRLLKF